MTNWSRLVPSDFEYDFENDELAAHHYRMADMSTKNKRNLSEKEIDRLVIAQADDDSAWSKPIRVQKTKPASISIPPELAARAAFLAQLHRTQSLDEWVTRVIEERIELEEAAFIGVKQDLTSKAG